MKIAKRIFSFLLVIVLLLPQVSLSVNALGEVLPASTTTLFSGGSGTSSDPYLISKPQDFLNLGNYGNLYGKHLRQTCDISMKGYTIVPIETFSGTYDGGGFAITDIVYTGTSKGIIAQNYGTIKNLSFENANITLTRTNSENWAGGIIGQNSSTVTGCSFSGRLTVQTTNTNYTLYAGGIAGRSTGTLKDCVNAGSVHVKVGQMSCAAPGGIVGYNDGTIQNCLNTGNITTENAGNTMCGGIVGYNLRKVISVKNTGSIQGTTCWHDDYKPSTSAYVGGIVGQNKGTVSYGQNYGQVEAIGTTSGDHAYAGGIAGYNGGDYNSAGPFVVEYSKNYGTILAHSTGGEARVGGIAGTVYKNSYARYCCNVGNLNASQSAKYSSSMCGGIAGCVQYGTVTQCCNHGEVRVNTTGYDTHSGCGISDATNAVITDCYNTGNIYSDYSSYSQYARLAGLFIDGDTTCQNSYNLGTLTSKNTSNPRYGLYGYGPWDENILIGCYTTNPYRGTPAASQITVAQAKLKETFKGYDFERIWDIDPDVNDGHPYLRNIPLDDDVNWYIDPALIVPVSGIILDKSSITLGVGDTVIMKATIIPEDAQNKKVRWYTGTSSVAQVDQNGKVTAVSAGNTYVYARAEGGSYTASCRIVITSLNPSFSGGSGTAQDPYLIATATDLQNILYNRTAHYRLIADISLAGLSWRPIGSENNPFSGSLDGNGFAIRDLYINAVDQNWVGLFGYSTGVIRNVRLNGCSVTAVSDVEDLYCGMIAGYNTGTVTNCKVEGTLSATTLWEEQNSCAGGICGYSSQVLDNCVFSGSVSAKVSRLDSIAYAGGIVGYGAGATNCRNYGAVSTSGAIDCDCYSGGILGCSTGGINNSYNGGAITAANSRYSFAGGISGLNAGPITSCANAGTVYANTAYKGSSDGDPTPPDGALAVLMGGPEALAGGITGSNYSTVSFCENNAYIRANSTSSEAYSGGIAGYNNANSVLENCKNSGEVTSASTAGESRAGGIASSSHHNSLVRYCCNHGRVSVTETGDCSIGAASGVLAVLQYGTLEQCCNHGDVYTTATLYETEAGGILASMSSAESFNMIATMKNCWNEGNVQTDFTGVGVVSNAVVVGIAGVSGYGNVIENCYNVGSLSQNGGATELWGLFMVWGGTSYTAKGCYVTALHRSSGANSLMTDAQSKLCDTYAGYDFTSVWSHNSEINNGRPYLANLPSDGDSRWYSGVREIVPVTQVTLNREEATLHAGNNLWLDFTYEPENATDASWYWVSSDPTIATVDQYGYVTAVAPGVAVITLMDRESACSASCEVTVEDHSYTSTVTKPTCTDKGYTTYSCTCGDSYVGDYVDATGHTYEEGICAVCNTKHPNMAILKGKVISILGDSISTFAGYIPTADGFNLEHRPRYPQDNLLSDVHETWWMQVIHDLGAKLGINDSWAGSRVANNIAGNSGDHGEKAAMASLTRILNLGANGTPDIILFYGGTNDIAYSLPLGSFNPTTAPAEVDLTVTKWDSVADAYVAAILRMKHFYPDAQIVAMLPTYTVQHYTDEKLEQFNTVFAAICEHYDVTYIDLRDCGITTADLPDGIHPNAIGMDYITKAVLGELLKECDLEEGETVVHAVTHTLSNAESSLGYYKGASHGKSFTTTITGEDVTVSVTMNGVDITASVYADGVVNIPNVTGDIDIIARGRKKTIYEDYLQQLPEDICLNTNLWKVLEPENIYYTSAGWGNLPGNLAWSVTIPVNVGDQIWANSFQAYGSNGNTYSSNNGIRVTWFGENGVLKAMTPEETYAEFATNGYIIAPEGAVAVNIPMWNNSDDNKLYILNRGHSHTAAVTQPTCTEQGYTTHTCHCGDRYVDAYVDPTGVHIYADGVCSYCGVEIIRVKSENMTQYQGGVNSENGTLNTTFTNNWYSDIRIPKGAEQVRFLTFKTGANWGSAFFNGTSYISGHCDPNVGGQWVTLNIPKDATTFRYGYLYDAIAQKNGFPVFEYLEFIGRDMEAWAPSEFMERPATGCHSFSVEVNIAPAQGNPDGYVKGTDYGYIQLPTNYTSYGEPTRLIIVCHGAGASLSTYQSDSWKNTNYSFWTELGYAVMDMYACPEELAGGRELHYGNPIVLECYKKGYDYVMEHFNLKQDGIFLIGSSMGGLSSFQIAQSGQFPVIAQVAYCPVIDLFKQAYCNPWTTASYQRSHISSYFGFTGTLPTFTDNKFPSQAEIDFYRQNFEKTWQYSPILNNVVAGDMTKIFEVIPKSATALNVEEEALYAQLTATHPNPLMIFHNTDDGTVAYRYSKYFVDMLKRSGQEAILYTFTSGAHNAWANGESRVVQGINGQITIKESQHEAYLFFEKFEKHEEHCAWVDPAVEPTCTKSGLTKGSHCAVCGEILVTQNKVEPNGHTYESVVTDPTCTEQGYTTHTCHCGDSYVDTYTEPTGHHYVAVEKKDVIEYTCPDCGDMYTEEIVYDLVSLTNTLFTTAWGMDFVTSIEAKQSIAKGAKFHLYYNADVAALVGVVGNEKVTINTGDAGELTIKVLEDVSADEVLLTLSFTTSQYLNSGSYVLLSVDENSAQSCEFTDLVIYEMGDVNLDGKINSRDVTMIKQYVVKMVELTDVQKIYANVYVDTDKDGNPLISSRDAMLIQQYVVKMPVKLGDRINVIFVYGEGERIVYSIREGEPLNEAPAAPEGYGWSISQTELVEPDFTSMSNETTYYLVKI